MSTISPPRRQGPAPGPSGGARSPWPWLRPREPESEATRAARMRQRKRLVLWSLPVVVLLLLVVLKLMTMVALGDSARAAYTAGDITGTEDAANRLGFLNLIEPHKAPFARGDARALAGDYDGARQAFEEALALAPRDSKEGCQVRVNLVLSIEKLAQAATSAGKAADAKAMNDRIQQIVADAPPGCFSGDSQEEGQQLRDAQQRAQDQNEQQQNQQQQQGQDQQQQQQPSQDKQQQLDDKTQDNLQQRNDSSQQQGSNQRSPVDKPW